MNSWYDEKLETLEFKGCRRIEAVGSATPIGFQILCDPPPISQKYNFGLAVTLEKACTLLDRTVLRSQLNRLCSGDFETIVLILPRPETAQPNCNCKPATDVGADGG